MGPPYIPTMPDQPPDRKRVFEYLDYREFLRDHYRLKKKETSTFSYRYIGGKIGLDPGTLTRIFQGERNLTPELSAPLARAFKLNDHEREYFETLVLFCQARGHTEKNVFLEKLLRLRGGKVKTLEERQYEFYRKWFYSALRELLNFFPCDGDFTALARMFRPSISPAEARQAVKLLLDLGLIEKDEKKGFRLTEQIITSGDGIRALWVNNLHLSMNELAARAIHEIEPAERDFSGLTLSLSRDGLHDVKAMVKQFRRDVLERARKDDNVNGVYQVNFQIFPLSWPYATEKK